MVEFNEIKKAISDLSDEKRIELINSLSKSKAVIPQFPGNAETEECRTGRILVGKTTVGHQAKLEKLGYSVTIEDGTLRNKVTGNIDAVKFMFIDCEGFVDEMHVNDLTTIVGAKKLFHYRTKIDFGNGRVVSGIEAVPLLGAWACLMAAPLSTLTPDR